MDLYSKTHQWMQDQSTRLNENINETNNFFAQFYNFLSVHQHPALN